MHPIPSRTLCCAMIFHDMLCSAMSMPCLVYILCTMCWVAPSHVLAKRVSILSSHHLHVREVLVSVSCVAMASRCVGCILSFYVLSIYLEYACILSLYIALLSAVMLYRLQFVPCNTWSRIGARCQPASPEFES